MSPHLGPFAFLPDFIDFTIWGDLQILQAAAELPDAEYHKDRGFSFGSLHKLLLHAMGAQYIWLSRFQGTAPTFPTDQLFPTHASLAKAWPETHANLRAFVQQQTPDSLQTTIHFRTFAGEQKSGRLGDLLLHVTDHATYHRGQQNSFLKLAGHPNAPLRVFFFLWRIEHPA